VEGQIKRMESARWIRGTLLNGKVLTNWDGAIFRIFGF
jgi:hypothetical protein